ncbi:ferredoxin [Candidatus Woesearchaeota archaeon]|nr:ferredoxin [Candidatus Woesearchaeota archaeon]
MAKFKITYDREACIGAAACAAVAPDLFEMNDDGKADLLESEEKDGIFTRIIDAKDEKAAVESADVCPVSVIKIEKIKD